MKNLLLPRCRYHAVPAVTLCLAGFPCLTGAVLPMAIPSPVFAAPAATVVVPAAPVPDKYIAFSDKVMGRRLLFAARDAYRNAPSLRVSSRWTSIAPSGTATTGTETILAQFGQGRVAITSETAAGGGKSVRRAVANGASAGAMLLVTEYREAKPVPTRQYSRYPLDELTPLTRSLQMARFAPATKAGEMLLTPDWRLQNAALVCVSRPDSTAGNTAIVQTDLAGAGDRARTRITRRYLVDDKTRRLRRYEEWRATQTQPRPATKNRPADNGLRVTYLREEYTEAAAPVTAAAFSQALPAGYTEQAPANAALPPVPKQPTADPKALALLRKWETAHERFFTLNAIADVRSDVQRRADDSRPNRFGRGRGAMLCTIWRMRPGQARIVVNDIDGKTQQPNTKADYVAVADGQNVRINDYGNGRSNTDNQRDPAVVPVNRMRQVVRQAWDSGIAWVFDGPPTAAEYSEIALDTTGANPALVFSRTVDGNTGRGQKAATRFLWRVTLGPDNLPREIVSRRDTKIIGGYDRDQPPAFTTTVRLSRIAVDVEPLPETFVLPQEIARR